MASGSRKRAAEDSEDVALSDTSLNANSHPKRAKSEIGGEAISSSSAPPPRKVDMDGNAYWEISKQRRITVASFRGRILIHIREFYVHNGRELPSKKGITMPVEQFSCLVTLLPEIETALKQVGQSLPRPEYNNDTTQASEVDALAQEVSTGTSKDVTSPKRNIDETTTEDDESEA